MYRGIDTQGGKQPFAAGALSFEYIATPDIRLGYAARLRVVDTEAVSGMTAARNRVAAIYSIWTRLRLILWP
ncbi:hypothetical protein ROSMUCSMR3_01386 [Roseovarius mucosus]|uniref:Uncharacterized protein n=1 Tax=Roseovarius mucosus TaxID=215743 RepID=A0A1V0RM74_9RHOB|nr:hypothetical protein ROSMUCSMR3_01386 [Roseovarius mucosus]